jgi:hypothetical protein
MYLLTVPHIHGELLKLGITVAQRIAAGKVIATGCLNSQSQREFEFAMHNP